MKMHALALVVALILSAPCQTTPPATPLKKGLWSYSGNLVISLDGKKLQASTKTWQFCARKTGEPPLVTPEGEAEIHCGEADTSPVTGGYHASRTCTSKTDNKTSTILEDFVVLPGPEGLTATMRGSIATGISGEDTTHRPLTVDVDSQGRWIGDCR